MAKARAHANVAVVKYWGKKSEARVIPTAPSLSVTLDALAVEAEVEFVAGGGTDEILIDGAAAAPEEARRVSQFLDRVRPKGSSARVQTRATFLRAAGLASSSAAFAALAVAGARAAGIAWDEARLAELARLGSGSACRSVTGGWTVWRNERPQRVAEASHWDLRVLVARVAAPERKPVSSTEGMRRSVQTSPFYAAWPAMAERDVEAALTALRARDLDGLGEIAERQSFALHALCTTARPPILYWTPATLEVLASVRRFSVDAGPHVFVFAAPAEAPAAAERLRALPGVREVIECRPAGGAQELSS